LQGGIVKNQLTVPVENMSPARNPRLRVSITAASILFAALSSPSPYLKSIAALSTVASGFALSCKIRKLAT